ncbi:16725_t:CDS:2 [Funneliformis mosseae]|uniref:16725_t:CDS:1 n=1 Tax=Funneliformis mosseae TaxID=27381 RepID=A0A9N9CPL1_FUNMO|nr:16725_t:CDS:2 [Funneliformis mosseae]
MPSVTLNCLVFGDDPYIKNFSIEINTSKNVNTLKKAINDDLKSCVATKELKLFKVYILHGKTRDENVVSILKLGDFSIGLEMDNLQKIMLSKKRKALEEVKKTWKVNSTLRETDWPNHYFVDPVAEGKQRQEQDSLFEKIEKRSFIMLYGTRASGKSTRAMRTISVLENSGYVCNYVTFEHIVKDVEGFWNSLCTNISLYKRSSGYLDPFDRIYQMDDGLLSDFLSTLRAIRNNIESYVIQAIVVIGTFSILHLDSRTSNTDLTSPFNIKDSIRNPNFDLEQVQEHAGLVSICGRAIEDNLLRKLNKRLLTYKTWECYKVSSLMDAMVDYQTFRNLVNSLKGPENKDALNFFRNNFLVDFGHEVKVTIDINSAESLASEGVLVPAEEAGAFKLSSPLIRWLILQRVIPIVFPSCPRNDVPFFKDSKVLDTLVTLKLATKSLDKDIISLARIRSYKIAKVWVNGESNQPVPRESVYDAELCRVLRNWPCPSMFQITGQWHLVYNKSSKRQHRYSDIVIDTPYGQKIVLELLATASNDDLIEHFQRALEYANLLSADETWIVHLTCEDEYVKRPLWPSDSQLKMKLHVAHFYHNFLFTNINLIAGWWNIRKNKMSTYRHSAEI